MAEDIIVPVSRCILVSLHHLPNVKTRNVLMSTVTCQLLSIIFRILIRFPNATITIYVRPILIVFQIERVTIVSKIVHAIMDF